VLSSGDATRNNAINSLPNTRLWQSAGVEGVGMVKRVAQGIDAKHYNNPKSCK
jgi:hypothetical protein